MPTFPRRRKTGPKTSRFGRFSRFSRLSPGGRKTDAAAARPRLARFNTNIEVVDKRFFQGLPSPAAAALVVGFVMMMTDPDINVSARQVEWVSWALALFAGLTMVTNVPFYSFKDVNFRKSVPFIAVFVIVLLFVAVSSDPPKVLFGLFILYGVSGSAIFFWRMFKGKPVSILQTRPEPGIAD